MKIKPVAIVAAIAAFTSFSCHAGLSPDEQEWAEQYSTIKAIGEQLNMPVKIRILRGTPRNITPAALDYNASTGECTLVIAPNVNDTADKIMENLSGKTKGERILSVMAHEYGHCVAYKTGFTKPGVIEAKDEAYADVFSIVVMSIVRPNSYNNVMRMYTVLRNDREVKSDKYSANWIKYGPQIWADQREPNVIAAEYATKQ